MLAARVIWPLLPHIAVAYVQIVVLVLLALLYALTRARNQLAAQRAIAIVLQRAFLSGNDFLPNVEVATAYRTAQKDVAVGGDLYEVRRLDARRSYILVADVSGKGLNAAVDTAFVRYTVRALASEVDDPRHLMRRFNALYLESAAARSPFVVVFFAILDSYSGDLSYVSAGFSPAFAVRGRDVSQLEVTGPAIGIDQEPAFRVNHVRLQGSDKLVIATDGLTEARDRRRRFLGDEGAREWIAEAADRPPAELVAHLVRRLKRYARPRLSDDLAVLALEYRGNELHHAYDAGLRFRF